MSSLLQRWKKESIERRPGSGLDPFIEICSDATSQSPSAGKRERTYSFQEPAHPGQDCEDPPQLQLLMQSGNREHNSAWLATSQREDVLGRRAETGWYETEAVQLSKTGWHAEVGTVHGPFLQAVRKAQWAWAYLDERPQEEVSTWQARRVDRRGCHGRWSNIGIRHLHDWQVPLPHKDAALTSNVFIIALFSRFWIFVDSEWFILHCFRVFVFLLIQNDSDINTIVVWKLPKACFRWRVLPVQG